MLHVEYLEQTGKLEILPETERQIPGLRDMLEHNFHIINPAKTFSQSYRKGELEGLDEDTLAVYAEKVNLISDLWNSLPDKNVMEILTGLMEEYCKAKKEIERLNALVETDFADVEDEDDLPFN